MDTAGDAETEASDQKKKKRGRKGKKRMNYVGRRKKENYDYVEKPWRGGKRPDEDTRGGTLAAH